MPGAVNKEIWCRSKAAGSSAAAVSSCGALFVAAVLFLRTVCLGKVYRSFNREASSRTNSVPRIHAEIDQDVMRPSRSRRYRLPTARTRSEEHTSELQSLRHL